MNSTIDSEMTAPEPDACAIRTMSRNRKLLLKKPPTEAAPSVSRPMVSRRRIGMKSDSRLKVMDEIENMIEYPVTIQEAAEAEMPKAAVTSGSARLNIAVFIITSTTAMLNSAVSSPSRGRVVTTGEPRLSAGSDTVEC
ncbi:hypothetical protein D3C71_1340150 [compost metagenome]